MYDPTVGSFLREDPIGIESVDVNFYRYCGNSPTNVTDPTGKVEFKITPEKVDSMDWYTSKLGGKGEVGRTVLLNLAVPWKGKPSSNGCGKVNFTVTADIHIRIDLAEFRKTNATITLMYGHEQVHVANLITILHREAKILAEVEEKEFKTPDEAKTAALEAIKKFETAVKTAYNLDAVHNSKEPKSPPKGKGLPPQGKMPKDPKESE
jgi:hypothetical protein